MTLFHLYNDVWIVVLEARLNNSRSNPQDFFFTYLMQNLKWKVHYSISSKGCEFQKPEQGPEVGEQGREEGAISSAVAVGWHYKDCFCQGKRWKDPLSSSILCSSKKAEVRNGIPGSKAVSASALLSLQGTLRTTRLFSNNTPFPLQQDNFSSNGGRGDPKQMP